MLRLTKFDGVMPKANPYSRPASVADVAINMDPTGGSLRSFRDSVLRGSIGTDRRFMLMGCDLIELPQGATSAATYFTSTREVVTAINGVLHLGVAELGELRGLRLLGARQPATAPAVIVQNSTAEKARWRVYAYTYVSPLGEETPPSPASPQALVLDGSPVSIHMSDPPPEGYTIRLYRTATAARSQEEALGLKTGMLLVAPLPVGTKMYVDTVKDGELGRGLDTVGETPPPDGVSIVVKVGDAIPVLAASIGHQLRFSKPHRPNSWDFVEELSLGANIISMVAGGGKLYVVTYIGTYLVDAMPSDGFRAVTHLVQAPPPLFPNQDAIVYTPLGAVYAASEGLYLVAPTGDIINLTAGIMTPHAYRKLFYNSVALGYSRGVLYISTGDKAYAMPLGEGIDKLAMSGLIEVPRAKARQYETTNTGQLYAADGSTVKQWDAGDYLTAVWETNIYEYVGALTAARALLASGTNANLIITPLPEGTPAEAKLSDAPVRLRTIQRSAKINIRIEVVGELISLGIAPAVRELKGASK